MDKGSKNSRMRKACGWLSGFCNAEMLETSLGCVFEGSTERENKFNTFWCEDGF